MSQEHMQIIIGNQIIENLFTYIYILESQSKRWQKKSSRKGKKNNGVDMVRIQSFELHFQKPRNTKRRCTNSAYYQ